MKRFILIGLIIGYLAGWYNAKSNFYYPNIYNDEGLKQLNDLAKSDNSKRIGIVLLTDKTAYTVSNLYPQKYQIFWGIMNVKGEILTTNLNDLGKNFIQTDRALADKIMAMA